MSVEYRLRCDMKATDSIVRQVLVQQGRLTEEGQQEIVLGRSPGNVEEERTEMLSFRATGLQCYFHAESSLGQSIIEEAFGFRPTRNITLRIDKFETHEEGIMNMMSICALIIKECSGDCVLLENGDFPLLLRRDGHLVLQSSDSYWTTGLEMMASVIGDPYTHKAMPLL